MPQFSARSRAQLETCHPALRALFEVVVRHHDCTVIEGHRPPARQDTLYKAGQSLLRAGQSLHNAQPSLAVDVIPYPVDWDDLPRFHRFSGFVFGVASQMGVALRWGGDWDRDWDLTDNRFNDLPHYELHDGPAAASAVQRIRRAA